MKKLTRKSFAPMLVGLKPMEKLNIMLELWEDLTKECKEESDFDFLKDLVKKYVIHKVKHLSKKI